MSVQCSAPQHLSVQQPKSWAIAWKRCRVFEMGARVPVQVDFALEGKKICDISLTVGGRVECNHRIAHAKQENRVCHGL